METKTHGEGENTNKPTHNMSTICSLFSADNGSMSTISSGPQNQQPFEVFNSFFTQTLSHDLSMCSHTVESACLRIADDGHDGSHLKVSTSALSTTAFVVILFHLI